MFHFINANNLTARKIRKLIYYKTDLYSSKKLKIGYRYKVIISIATFCVKILFT